LRYITLHYVALRGPSSSVNRPIMSFQGLCSCCVQRRIRSQSSSGAHTHTHTYTHAHTHTHTRQFIFFVPAISSIGVVLSTLTYAGRLSLGMVVDEAVPCQADAFLAFFLEEVCVDVCVCVWMCLLVCVGVWMCVCVSVCMGACGCGDSRTTTTTT
jgi:hypothetical protein